MIDDTTTEKREAAGRHATNLELFIDLVFVFAISQLTKLLGADISVAGIGKGLVVAWTVWWVWGQFTWLGTAVDLDRDVSTRLTFLASILPTLFMAIAIPGAFTDTGPQFGLAVLGGSLWAMFLQGRGLWDERGTRTAFVRYASLAVIGPLIIGVGGFVGAAARPWVWAGAALFGVAGAVASGGKDELAGDSQWRIDPVHFSERHALFVIIVLGEVLVAIGAAATAQPLTWATGWAVVAAAYFATVVFWSYFGFVAQFGEMMLRQGDARQRTATARSFFTFGHFPLIAGIACLATVIEHVVAHPDEHLHVEELSLLMVAIVLVLGAFMTMHWTSARGIAPERPVAAAACGAVLLVAGEHLPAAAILAVVAIVLTVMQAITVNRFQQINPFGSADLRRSVD